MKPHPVKCGCGTCLPRLLTTLSLSARLLLILGPPSTVLLVGLLSPTAALLTPLTFTPSLYLYHRYRLSNNQNHTDSSSLRRHAPFEPLLWTGITVGTFVPALAAIFQLGICKLATLILFGSRLQSTPLEQLFISEFQRTSVQGVAEEALVKRWALARSWGNWGFNLVLSFLAAGAVEEVFKYLPVVWARWQDGKKKKGSQSPGVRGEDEKREGQGKGSVNVVETQWRGNRAYIDFALAGTLGFGLVEAIGFIYGSCVLPERERGWGMLILTVFERVAGQMGHLALAALAGVRATRREFYAHVKGADGEEGCTKESSFGWCSDVWPSVFFHGLADFMALSASAMEGHVGFIHPKERRLVGGMLGTVAVVWAMAFGQLRKEWKELDRLDGLAVEKEKGNR
ncbi:hypothetical protein BKA65DRAFT_531203 [Rhexocercosporidium sp. MPI-PUGE-AT-0058]|nr:hypothetical protein BKA65DRAFT_531203 [Rhexocercosporidium sp. MPI-PUGE-AT-0058]